MSGVRVNMSVMTPLGRGTVFGCYGTLNPDGSNSNHAHWVVQLPIEGQAEKAKRRAMCLTPRAEKSGLFIFEESELS